MNKYETLFLDWFNNFYSTKYMSSYYNINQSKLKRQLSRGRRIHYKQLTTRSWIWNTYF